MVELVVQPSGYVDLVPEVAASLAEGALGSREAVEHEIDLMYQTARQFWSMEPDEVLLMCSAMSARCAELETQLWRVEAKREWHRVRTMQVERLHNELERQTRIPGAEEAHIGSAGGGRKEIRGAREIPVSLSSIKETPTAVTCQRLIDHRIDNGPTNSKGIRRWVTGLWSPGVSDRWWFHDVGRRVATREPTSLPGGGRGVVDAPTEPAAAPSRSPACIRCRPTRGVEEDCHVR